jgi:hypothetical protein
MHLVYIDEVKYDPPHQPRHWLCGLAIPADEIKSVEADLDSLADGYFGSRVLDKSTEFHAVDIVHGKGPYSGRDMAARLELLKSLSSIVEKHPQIGRIHVCLDPARMKRDDFEGIAFMFLVERVDQLMSARKSLGLLIADHDAEFASENVRSLSSFKAAGTEFQFGQSITNLVDTVHHTHSHHSRLLQLADLYVYSIALAFNKPDRFPKKEFVEHIRSLDPYLFPDKYKHWPPES